MTIYVHMWQFMTIWDHQPISSTCSSRLHLDSFPACVLAKDAKVSRMARPSHSKSHKSRRVGSGSKLTAAASFGPACQWCHNKGIPIQTNALLKKKFSKNGWMHVHAILLFDDILAQVTQVVSSCAFLRSTEQSSQALWGSRPGHLRWWCQRFLCWLLHFHRDLPFRNASQLMEAMCDPMRFKRNIKKPEQSKSKEKHSSFKDLIKVSKSNR